MKKGAKLMEAGYLVEISDLDNNYLFPPRTSNSLRQAVAYAAEKHPAMDSYLNVYRQFTARKGAYVNVLLTQYEDASFEHMLVKIRSFEVYTAEGIAHAEAWMKRLSEMEAKALRKRSTSR